MPSHGFQWVSNLVHADTVAEVGMDMRFAAGALNATPPVLQPIRTPFG